MHELRYGPVEDQQKAYKDFILELIKKYPHPNNGTLPDYPELIEALKIANKQDFTKDDSTAIQRMLIEFKNKYVTDENERNWEELTLTLQNELFKYDLFRQVFDDPDASNVAKLTKGIRDDIARFRKEIKDLTQKNATREIKSEERKANKERMEELNTKIRHYEQDFFGDDDFAEDLSEAFAYASHTFGYSLQLIARRLYMLKSEEDKLLQFGVAESAARSVLIKIKETIADLGKDRWTYPKGVKKILGYIERAEKGEFSWMFAALMIQQECNAPRLEQNKMFRDEKTKSFYRDHKNVMTRVQEKATEALDAHKAAVSGGAPRAAAHQQQALGGGGGAAAEPVPAAAARRRRSSSG